jgi:hypothetical protein
VRAFVFEFKAGWRAGCASWGGGYFGEAGTAGPEGGRRLAAGQVTKARREGAGGGGLGQGRGMG